MSENNYSVIICPFQRHEYMEECIESVINQSIKPSEIIIVLNGSSEEVKKISKKIKQNAPNLVWIYDLSEVNPINTYLSTARNFGIIHAKFSWIAFIDDDDIWFPNKIELQINFCLSRNLDACSCLFYEFDQHGQSYYSMIPRDRTKELKNLMKIENYFSGGSQAIAKKECLIQSGLFDEKMKTHEDHDFWRRFISLHKAEILEEFLVKYRRSQARLSSSRSGNIVGNVIHLRKILLDNKFDVDIYIFEKISNIIRLIRKSLLFYGRKNKILYLNMLFNYIRFFIFKKSHIDWYFLVLNIENEFNFELKFTKHSDFNRLCLLYFYLIFLRESLKR